MKPRDPYAFIATVSADNRTVVGTYLDQQLSDKLALIAILEGTSRSALIAGIIENHFNNSRLVPGVEDILVKRAVGEWESYLKFISGKNIDPKKEFDKYLAMITKSLKKRHIPQGMIEQIIRKVKKC